ncbi:TPA: hypothetical protein N0F65_008848 [Lagenidium giganteum]|uniref:Retrotransposon gag domain-containing protein n=1 Tax=Lagenidium giganteum TaxID=4803 RepID=A0AAV2YQE3_9STRA|nr:TPA: hypothetical protein N0F65_008848 [Lagenidium giganteum]
MQMLESFKLELRAAFEPPENEFRTRLQFLSLHQEKQDMHGYVQRARMLLASILADPVNQTQLAVFIAGMCDGLVKSFPLRSYPRNLKEAVQLASREGFGRFDRPLRALLDTGASNNFVRPGGGSSGLPYEEPSSSGSQLVVRLANGTTTRCVKQSVRLMLNFGSCSNVDSFIVLEMEKKFDLILGMPWVARHQPEVDCVQRKILSTKTIDSVGHPKRGRPQDVKRECWVHVRVDGPCESDETPECDGLDVPSADTVQVEPPPAIPTDHTSDVDARRGILKRSSGRVATRSSGSRSKKRVKFDFSAAEPSLRRRKGDDEDVSADTPRKDAARDRIHPGQRDNNPTVAPPSERAASGVDAVRDGIQREIVNAVICHASPCGSATTRRQENRKLAGHVDANILEAAQAWRNRASLHDHRQ